MEPALFGGLLRGNLGGVHMRLRIGEVKDLTLEITPKPLWLTLLMIVVGLITFVLSL